MAARKKPAKKPTKVETRSVEVEADKLERARKFLNAPSDAEVVRLAIDHLLSHFEPADADEEE